DFPLDHALRLSVSRDPCPRFPRPVPPIGAEPGAVFPYPKKSLLEAVLVVHRPAPGVLVAPERLDDGATHHLCQLVVGNHCGCSEDDVRHLRPAPPATPSGSLSRSLPRREHRPPARPARFPA